MLHDKVQHWHWHPIAWVYFGRVETPLLPQFIERHGLASRRDACWLDDRSRNETRWWPQLNRMMPRTSAITCAVNNLWSFHLCNLVNVPWPTIQRCLPITPVKHFLVVPSCERAYCSINVLCVMYVCIVKTKQNKKNVLRTFSQSGLSQRELLEKPLCPCFQTCKCPSTIQEHWHVVVDQENENRKGRKEWKKGRTSSFSIYKGREGERKSP